MIGQSIDPVLLSVEAEIKADNLLFLTLLDMVPPVQHYSSQATGASDQPIGAPNTSRRFGSYLPIGWQEG